MSHSNIYIALAGPKGRLGSQICKAMETDHGTYLETRLSRKSPFGGLLNADSKCDMVLDVSSCEGVIQRLPVVLDLNLPLVIGVTGFTADQKDKIQKASEHIPVLLCGNFSIGVNQLLLQVKQTAKAFGKEAQIKISETHHINKKDYPSGTALMIAQAVMDGIGCEKRIKSTLWPEKLENNSPDILPIICYRKSDVIGEHSVEFTKDNEQVVLGHTALDREIFARGALRAARWIVGQKPGLYAMSDVLGS